MPMDFENIPNEDLKHIIQQGMATPFWEWLSYRMSITQTLAEKNMHHAKIACLDDCIRLGNWNAIWKTVNELANAPRITLEGIAVYEQQKQNPPKPTA